MDESDEKLKNYKSYKLNYIPGMHQFTKQSLYQIQKLNLNQPLDPEFIEIENFETNFEEN